MQNVGGFLSFDKDNASLSSSLEFDSFQDPLFLRNNQLTEKNVLEYFYNSKFFDTTSINQKRRRGIFIPPDADGIEYKVVASNAAGLNEIPTPFDSSFNYPNQFGVHIIQKVCRIQGVETPERTYYCAGSTIYQAPSLSSVVLHRLANCCDHLDKSVQLLEDMLHWSVLSSYHWKANMDVLGVLDQIMGDDNELVATTTPSELSPCSDKCDSSSEKLKSDQEEESSKFQPTKSCYRMKAKRTLSYKRIKQLQDSDTDTSEDDEDEAVSVAVIFQPREIAHASGVINKEFQDLFKASNRLNGMFTKELEVRQTSEVARRDIFVKCHELLDNFKENIFSQCDGMKFRNSIPFRSDPHSS